MNWQKILAANQNVCDKRSQRSSKAKGCLNMNYRPTVKTLQFLAIQKLEVMRRLIRRPAAQEAVVILDLEDALWDVTDPTRTAKLKADGRKELLAFVQKFPWSFSQRRIGIRLNRIASDEFKLDVEALAQITGRVQIDTIVVTKVESAGELADSILQFAANHVRYNHLVPIIETKSGISNLDGIMDEARKNKVEDVVYGHYDYSLDSEQWPFLACDETAYWEHLIPIVRQIEDKGLNTIHSPLFEIYDDARFSEYYYRICTVCRRGFGVLTLGEQQTSLCLDLAGKKSVKACCPLRDTRVSTREELIQSAKTTIRSFEEYRRANVSFVLDTRSGCFISPHVYLAAVRYLEKEQNG